MPRPRLLALVPKTNAPGKRDVTGAFLPEARAWLRHHGGNGEIVSFDNELPVARRRGVVEGLLADLEARGETFAAVGFFCHGLWRSLQTGHQIAHAAALAARLVPLLRPPARVVLYACDAADNGARARGPGGDEGFADELRDACLRVDFDRYGPALWGGWIDAHSTTGHTTTNPYVRRFRFDPLPHELTLGLVGGEWLVEPPGSNPRTDPGSPLWPAWRAALGRPSAPGPMRLAFPLLSAAEIHHELGGKA